MGKIASKQSFFEKKDQKTFALPVASALRFAFPSVRAGIKWRSALSARNTTLAAASEQKFFASFFQKRRPFFLLPFLFYATSSHAHAFLDLATPRVGSTVPASPTEIVLTFTQAVEPAFSKIEVTDQAGTHEETEAAHLAGSDKAKLAVGIPKLPPGTYLVTWHVTSGDTHKSQGKFRFTVAR